jgi:hypothetical protein
MNEFNAIIILKALLMGLPCGVGAYTYHFDVDNRLCVEATNVTTGKDILLTVNFGEVPIQDFVGICASATEDEMTVIGANIGLNEVKA